MIKIFACNIATSQEESLACSIARETDSTVYAYYGKTLYSNIMGTRTPKERLIDRLWKSVTGAPKSDVARAADKAYAENPKYHEYIPWRGAFYPPISAGYTDNVFWNNGYTDSYAMMALPDGSISKVPGGEIPDIATHPIQRRNQTQTLSTDTTRNARSLASRNQKNGSTGVSLTMASVSRAVGIEVCMQ